MYLDRVRGAAQKQKIESANRLEKVSVAGTTNFVVIGRTDNVIKTLTYNIISGNSETFFGLNAQVTRDLIPAHTRAVPLRGKTADGFCTLLN